MFENYSYKKKCIALVILFFMLSITAYKRSFHTLIEIIRENKSLKLKAEDFSKKSNNLNSLINDNSYLEKTIGEQNSTKDMVQQGIINFASKKQPQISINDLQAIHIASDSNYNIITNQLDITGNVNQLVRLGYDFEKEFYNSRVISMNFYTSKKNNKSDILHLKMIFQNYENN